MERFTAAGSKTCCSASGCRPCPTFARSSSEEPRWRNAVDPLALLKAIRAGLEPGGTYLLLEINCADHAHDNQGPIAQVLYGFSLLYCMTSSVAHDGAGLGTCGLPESSIRALAADAGFATVTRVAENPFNVLYALTN